MTRGQFNRLYCTICFEVAVLYVKQLEALRQGVTLLVYIFLKYQFGSKTMQNIFHHISLDSVECWA